MAIKLKIFFPCTFPTPYPEIEGKPFFYILIKEQKRNWLFSWYWRNDKINLFLVIHTIEINLWAHKILLTTKVYVKFVYVHYISRVDKKSLKFDEAVEVENHYPIISYYNNYVNKSCKNVEIYRLNDLVNGRLAYRHFEECFET